MTDLTTTYLGLKLKHPLVASASPLTKTVDGARRLEDAGVSAIVLHSLFEEQLEHETLELDYLTTQGTQSFAEALSYFPEPKEFNMGPEEYLEHIHKAKQATLIPMIGSLNGVSSGGWIEYAKKTEKAGADALELNIYFLATDPTQEGRQVENQYRVILNAVKSNISIPVAVKVAPYFSAMANMAARLHQAGAAGLVLFNRFLQPDITLDELEVAPHLVLSTSDELRLALRWIAILRGRVGASLAATGGAHTPEDVLKLLLAGADCVMLASSLLMRGPNHVGALVKGIEAWMSEREYTSVAQMKGSLSQQACPDPDAFERANYMKALKSYTSELV